MPKPSSSASGSSSGQGFLRFLSGGRYLTPQMCKNLLAYKYDGEDRSFLYRYVLQPMNARLIRFVPIWAAPNLITLVGLSIMVSAYLATNYFSPAFDQQMPGFMYVMCALALFCYQTIDNLDGRQARRTGSSSPLGLLFDHGVDALNCTIASLLLASVYSIGQSGPVAVFLFWNVGYIPFVVATWEEYYTGKLTLAEVNGPSDGMALCMLFSLFGYFMPGIYFRTLGEQFPQFFAGGAVDKLPINIIPLIIGYAGIVATLAGNLYQVSKKVTSWGRPLSKLLPFVTLSFCSWTWVLTYPTFFGQHARIFCFSMGFLFCQMICSMMIAHVCHIDYTLKRSVLLGLITAWVNCVIGPMIAPTLFPLISPDLTLYALLAFNFFCWLHFVVNVTLEITELLKIECFRIVPKDVGHDGSTVQVANEAVAKAAAAAAAAKSALVSPNSSMTGSITNGSSTNNATSHRSSRKKSSTHA